MLTSQQKKGLDDDSFFDEQEWDSLLQMTDCGVNVVGRHSAVGEEVNIEGWNMNENQKVFLPLHAEDREKYVRRFKFELNPGCEGRAAVLYEQLKARSNPWGIGLWKDEDTEKVAKRCAEIFIENFLECPNDRLVPQDRMEMVFALNDSGDLEDVEAIDQIESEFECKIPKEFYTSEKTFVDFVECVKAGRGKTPLEEVTTKDWLSLSWWLAVLLFLLVGLPSYAIYRLCVDIRTIVLEGWTGVSIGSLIVESFCASIGLAIIGSIVWSIIKADGKPDQRITKM